MFKSFININNQTNKAFISKMNVFDMSAKIKQRNRAALWPNSEKYDYLREEVAYRMADRIFDVKRVFEKAVDFGCSRGYLRQHLTTDYVKYIYQVDNSINILNSIDKQGDVPTSVMLIEDESFPFDENSLDLVVSSLHLHWINDLPGVMKQICTSLKPDGCFMGVMFGGDTLYQLRSAFYLADNERSGGFGPHIAPFVDNRDLGGLLNNAGFNLLTIDTDEITVYYPSVFELMHDLRGMGNNNCCWNRVGYLERDIQFAAAAIYQAMYGEDAKALPEIVPESEEPKDSQIIPATYQLLHFIAWKPHPSQQKPAKRGSATASFKDLGKIVQEQDAANEDDKNK